MKKIVLSAILMLATSAFAQDSKWYVGGEIGMAKVEDTTPQTAQIFVGAFGGAATATQDTGVGVGRIFLGYQINPMIALEGGYFSSNDVRYRVNGVSGGAVAYTATGDVAYSGFDYTILFKPFQGDANLKGLFVGVGGHKSELDATVSLSAAGLVFRDTWSQKGSGYLYTAGYDFDFSKQLFGRLKLTRLEKLAGDKDEKTTMYSFALGYKF